MKRITTGLLIFVMVLSLLLSACSESAKEELGKADKETAAATQEETAAAAEATEEDAAAPAAEPAGDKVEIEFWYGLGSVAGETMEGLIKEFNESQDKIHLTGVQQPSYDDTFQKVQAAIAANQPPACFISDNMQELARRDILEPLDDYLDERTPVDDYLEVFMSPAQIDGHVYALPGYGTTQVIYYRKDILDQAGIDPEEMYSTWENVYKYSKELQEGGYVEYGHLPMWGPNNMVDFARSNGGQILSEDGTKVTINTPEWVDAWEFVRKQIFEDKTTKIESGGQGWEYWYRTIDNVMDGTAVSYTGSSGDKGDLDFSIIDSAVQPGLNGNPGKPQSNALYFVIPKSATPEQKAAAFEWLAFFTSPEVSARWSMKIGYIPVRKTVMDVPEYQAFVEENPYAGIPYKQAMISLPAFDDPTNGKILDAISIATDKVQLENVPAQEALDEAQQVAQEALDEALNK